MTRRAMSKSAKRRRLAKVALAPIAFVVALLCAEGALRLYHGELFTWENLRSHFWVRKLVGKPADVYDAHLGWVPEPGTYEHAGTTASPAWSTAIGPDRLRTNGGERPAGRPLLAVGDSFTFGNEVDDGETWPAYLEQILDRAVLNGGTSSYGLDQVVMRAEQLLVEHQPEVVVLAYIGDDIQRCQLSFYTTWKPYFDIADGELVLRNSPVPPGSTVNGVWEPAPPPELGWVGYSYVARSLLLRLDRNWWIYGMGREHKRGHEVASLLLRRIARSAREHGAKLVVARLYPELNGTLDPPAEADCLREEGAAFLDLAPEIWRKQQDSGPGAVTRPSGHLVPAMNRWVAERLAELVRPLLLN